MTDRAFRFWRAVCVALYGLALPPLAWVVASWLDEHCPTASSSPWMAIGAIALAYGWAMGGVRMYRSLR